MVETELKNPNKFWLRYERSEPNGVPSTLYWHDVTLDHWTFLGMATSRNSVDKFPDSIEFWTKWKAKESRWPPARELRRAS